MINENALNMAMVEPDTVTMRSGHDPSDILILAPDCKENVVRWIIYYGTDKTYAGKLMEKFYVGKLKLNTDERISICSSFRHNHTTKQLYNRPSHAPMQIFAHRPQTQQRFAVFQLVSV